MRRVVFAVAVLGLFPHVGAAQTETVNSSRLVLPPVVYAVAGTEINLYYENLILTPPGRVWIFDVACTKGRQMVECWTWVPKDEDVGDLPLSIEVRDADDKVIGNAKTIIRVASSKAGSGQPVRMLCIGDSGTHASAYTAELIKSCAAPDQPRLTLLGTHHPPFAGPGNNHEGYGGWRFQDFLEKYTDNPVPGDHVQRSSPFVFASAKGPVFDVPRYIKESLGDVPPDLITMFLGANELGPISFTPTKMDPLIDEVLVHADQLVAGWRMAAPKAKIALMIMYPPANQDGFGFNYGGTALKYWSYRRVQHRLVEKMIEKYGNRDKDGLYLIPLYVNLDLRNAFPTELQPANARTTEKVTRIVNGLHLTASGYAQLSDSIFGWMKCLLAQDKP